MKTWLVSYADAAFRVSLERLIASAERFGIDERRAWNREALERTWFYAFHKSVLDRRPGSGYWLWKPFIIKETLKEMAPGDVLVYSDAGIEIVASLDPLIHLCAKRRDLTLFAGHYDDVGAPGPNRCGKWTKRDCFVFMDCDEPRYYDAQMVDASMILVPNTPAGAARVREWLLYCCQAPLITDAPNVCGLPDRPGFIEHRRDQSILSLLAARDGIELFRHPSQYGNHLKLAACRVDGEPTCFPYGAKGIYDNSPYGTLVNHHRGRLKGLRVDITRVLHAPRERVFEAWNRPDAFVNASALGCHVLIPHGDVRVGREFQVLTKKISGEMSPPMTGAYLKVEPPACLAYRWPWDTTVTVNFQDDGGKTIVTLTHEPFPNERMWYFQNVMWQRLLDGLAVHLDRVVEAEGDPLVEA